MNDYYPTMSAYDLWSGIAGRKARKYIDTPYDGIELFRRHINSQRFDAELFPVPIEWIVFRSARKLTESNKRWRRR